MSGLSSHLALSSVEEDNLLRGLRLLMADHGGGEFERLDDFPVRLVRAGWDELAKLTLPVLALSAQGCFLIKRIAPGVAAVCYPLLGDILLLRPWVEERWSGEVLVVEPPAACAVGGGHP